jgi:1,2-phenylacetyl-CoA epoxidase catalytic subunit
MKFTTFRRLALSPSSGEERKGGWSVRVPELKSKVNKVKIGIDECRKSDQSLKVVTELSETERKNHLMRSAHSVGK